MKSSKKISFVFLFIILIVGTNKLTAQNANKSVLIIKVFDGKNDYSKIVVTENSIKLEEIPLQEIGAKGLESNQIELNKITQKYINSGYRMISSVGLVYSPVLVVTTYIYEKDNK